jgi:hypothetical protein
MDAKASAALVKKYSGVIVGVKTPLSKRRRNGFVPVERVGSHLHLIENGLQLLARRGCFGTAGVLRQRTLLENIVGNIEELAVVVQLEALVAGKPQ